MISIQDATGDKYGRKTVFIEHTAEDGNSYWHINLTTSDLPINFESIDRPKVRVDLLDNDIAMSRPHRHALFFPMVLAGISQIEGKTRYYFRQKFASDMALPTPQIDLYCHIDKDTGDGNDPNVHYDINNLYLRIDFEPSLVGQDDQSMQSDQSRQRNNDHVRESTMVAA